MRLRLIQQFLQLESASAILLFMMALFALLLANSPLAAIHQQFLHAFLFWINEGLMAVFFLVVGLELKRECLGGELSQFSQIVLPLIAAMGGMLVPAIIYIIINYGNPVLLKGWATPVATDIAFALGVLSLFGKRVPLGLKLFLMTLAIFDDVGAIIIIALFYSHGLSYLSLFQAGVLFLILWLLNQLNVRSLLTYLLIGAFLWISFLRSGVHPTIAGVLLALTIPVDQNKVKSPLHRLEKTLHPWVAYLIMPLFALANAGFSFRGLSWNSIWNGLVMGIVAGLFIGKQLGVFAFSWLLIQSGQAKLPQRTSWLELYGVALLCGIGFTMSLFLGTLPFQNRHSIYLSEVRLGVIIGSILSGLLGAAILWVAFYRKAKKERSSIVE